MKKKTKNKTIPYRVMTATGLAVMMTTSVVSPVLPVFSTVAKAEEVNPILGSRTATPHRYTLGSSYWVTSNLREWMNSDQFEVQYTNQAPSFDKLNSKAYDKEPGFLTNFTTQELDAIAVTERRAFVNGNDGSLARNGGSSNVYRDDGYTAGPFVHFASPNINNAWQSVFYQTVNEKAFILSPHEIYEYVQKRGMPLQKSLTNEAKSRFNISSEYYPWISTQERSDVWAEQLFSVGSDGKVNYTNVNANYGIAPAMHIKPTYVFSNGKKASDVQVGEKVVFGQYNGQAVEWTVINKTPEGYPLLWATKLLTLKVFDTQGDDTLMKSVSVNFTTADISIKDDLKFTNGKADTQAPSIKVVNTTDLDTPKNGKWTLVVEASDSETGIKEIILPNGTKVQGSRVEYEITENGYYYFTAVDNAGNYYGASVPVGNINPPASVVINTSANGWTNKDVTVDIFASNADAGVEKTKYTQSTTGAGGSGYWPEYSSYAGKRIKATGTVRMVEFKKDPGNIVTGLRVHYNFRKQIGTDYHIGRTYPTIASIPLKDLMDGQPHTIETTYTVPGNYFNRIASETMIGSSPVDNGNWIVEWTNVKFELLDKEDFGIEKIILPNGTEIASNSYSDTITKEGTYTYKVLDSRGMVTEKTVEVKIDKTAPILSITGNPTQKINKDAVLRVQATDSQSGVKRIQKPNGEWQNGSALDYTVFQNGTYTFQVEDNAGNVSTQTVTVSNIDKTPPSMPQYQPSTSSPTNQNVTVTINYSSDSVKKEYRVNGGAWTTYSTPILMTENGTIEARATDDIGNVSYVSSYQVNNIDRVAPNAPTFAPDISSDTNKDVKVTVNYSSDSSLKQYRINGGVWQTYSTPIAMTTNGLIEARGYDQAGNLSGMSSYSVDNVDKTNPYAGSPYSISGEFVNSNTYKVRVSGVGDGKSGISKVAFPTWTEKNGQDDLKQPWSEKEVGVDLGNGVWEYTINTSEHNNEDGVYITHVYVYDKAGNSVMVGSVGVTVDRVAPVQATISAEQTNPTNQNVLVTIVYPSDAQIKEYRLNGGSWQSYTNAITMTANGKIEASSFDKANNQSTLSAYNVTNIDKVAPTTPVLTPSTTSKTNQDVSVTIQYPSDSIIKQYRLNGGSWQTYSDSITLSSNNTVEARALDEAGNVSNVGILSVTNIDKTAPLSPTFAPSITTPTNQNVSISINYPSDSKLKEYRINGGNWNLYTSAVSMTGNGLVEARATDEAGNISALSSYQVNNIDKVAPVKPVLTPDVTNATNTDVVVSVSYPMDAKLKEVRINGEEWESYTTPVVFAKNGTVDARAFDEAGNVSPVSTFNVSNIDKVAPSAPKYQATENKNKLVATKDADSVLTYRVNDGVWKNYEGDIVLNDGTYKVDFRALDQAGNVSETVSGEFVMYRDSLEEAQNKVSYAESNITQENVSVAYEKVDSVPHEKPEYLPLKQRVDDLQALLDAQKAIETAVETRSEEDVAKAKEKIDLLNNSNPIIIDLLDEVEANFEEADILALVAKERYDILSSKYEMSKPSYTALVQIYYAIKYTGDNMYKMAEDKVALVPVDDKYYEFVQIQLEKLQEDYNQFVEERIQTDAEIKAEASVQVMEGKYDPTLAVNTQNLINAVEDSTVRASLQQRLDTAKAKYESSLLEKVEQNAISAVEKAESTKNSYYVSEAYKKVNYLTNQELKFELTVRLQTLEAEMAYDRQVADATRLVQFAEQYKSQYYIDLSQKKIDVLPEGEDKTSLQKRLDVVKSGMATTDQATVIKNATNYVSLAQTMKTQYYVDKAQGYVDQITDPVKKAELQAKLDAIVVK